MSLSYKEIAEILKIIDSSNCTELVLEIEGARLVVRRRGASGPGESGMAPPQAEPASAPLPSASSAPPAETGGSPAAPQPRARTDGQIEIRAPMVGTFYRAPSPQAPSFVEPGGHVEPGDPLCLIEVMKLFTTIEATQAGRVVEIAAENGQLVEYDQLLFVIEPDRA